MNDVVEFLEDYIWENGFEKLSEKPFEVYKAMDKHGIKPRIVLLVLVTLMSKTHEMARGGCSDSELVDHMQLEHCLNKKTAKSLASMYLELFSKENKESWDDAKEAGFQEFCEEEWTVEWSGNCDWHTKHGGSYPRSAEATLIFSVRDAEKLHDHLSSELKSNPFLSPDEILRILSRQIEQNLDDDLEDYCSADDYYEPFLDDFVNEGTYESEKNGSSLGNS